MMDEGAVVTVTDTNPDAIITLGISIEPAQNVAAKLSSLSSRSQGTSTNLVKSTPQTPGFPTPLQLRPAISTKFLAQRIIENAFNYLASFAVLHPRGQGEVVPLKAFRDWWAKFERKIDADPGFLEKGGDGY
jgi:hypothetical protein